MALTLFQQMAKDLRDAFEGDLEARDVVFRRYASTTDLVEGSCVETLAASTTLPGLILPVSESSLEGADVSFMKDVVDATSVRLAIFAAEGAAFCPGPKDRAVLYPDGREWIVLGNTPINPDGATDLVYTIGFRLP